MTTYFCYEYYSFLDKNRLAISKTPSDKKPIYEIGNNDTPVFIFIFDELSSYLVLNDEGKINEELFPELKDFSNTSTLYPNATTQASDTVTTLSSIFSGYDYINKCDKNKRLCKHSIIRNLILGKSNRKNFFSLNGIQQKVNTMDRWYPIGLEEKKDDYSIISKNKNEYVSLNSSLSMFTNSIFETYMLSIINKDWSSRIQGLNTFLDLTKNKYSRSQILKGRPQSYGFLACISNMAKSIERFKLFIDRINLDHYSINTILTNISHAPFCYDEDGMVEVVYPIRMVPDSKDKKKINYIPDALSMIDLTQTSCNYDEIAFNVRRSRINQSKLATKLFKKALEQIKNKGIFDKSLIIAMSDHGVGFLGPSFGRGTHLLRNRDDILDNRMMNASILLMIKYPHQSESSVDLRLVRPIDIGATLLDILKINPPWSIDGQSLLKEQWKDVEPPLDFYQLLYEDNTYDTSEKGIWVEGEIIAPMDYQEVIKHKIERIDTHQSKWIGIDVSKLPLTEKKSGRLEYLKIEKALADENIGEYMLMVGGYSYDTQSNPSDRTYISVNNKILKSIKPCLSFFDQHKISNILGGWVVSIPRDVITSKKLSIRAFSPVENSNEQLFYELENPINIELTDEQFRKVGNYH